MAGTDSSKAPLAVLPAADAPIVILVRPQLGENIGAASRAMANFGLSRLRLVRPRGPWPSKAAQAMASGAGDILDQAEIFATVEEAIADLTRVYATTARPRDMVKPALTAASGARRLLREARAGRRIGVLFGPERTGLTNDEVALADATMMIPANPAFASLNLAQAVLVVGYELFSAAAKRRPETLALRRGAQAASREALLHLFRHLEDELDRCGFLRNREKRPRMVRNLRNIFVRADLTDQEVRTLRGVIKELVLGRRDR